MRHGTLYLIPTPLGEGPLDMVLPAGVRALACRLDTFIVERPKTARAFLKQLGTDTPLPRLTLLELSEHTPEKALKTLLEPLLTGKDVGLISEAGAPAVADPGANLVRLAHAAGIRVIPVVGPSAILLALMASGLNGQRFAFHGYLPVEKQARRDTLRELEARSARWDETEIFIETPYRNEALFAAILEHCAPHTLLCVASDVACATESIHTRTLADWARQPPALHKRPSVFLLYAR